MNNTTTNTPAHVLFAALTNDYPPPWRAEYHVYAPAFVSKVVASNGDVVLSLETHSVDFGDGELGTPGALALVEFVNVTHAMNTPAGPTEEEKAENRAARQRLREKIWKGMYKQPNHQPIALT